MGDTTVRDMENVALSVSHASIQEPQHGPAHTFPTDAISTWIPMEKRLYCTINTYTSAYIQNAID